MKEVQVDRFWKLLASRGEQDLPDNVGQRLIEQRVEEDIATLRDRLAQQEHLLELLHKDRNCKESDHD